MTERRDVDRASRMAARWLSRAGQVTDPTARFFGSFPAGSRTPDDLIWGTSAAIRGLLAVYRRTSDAALRNSAILGAKFLESIESPEEAGKYAGSLWSPWLAGSEPLAVDVCYRSISALMDLYFATGSPSYMEIAKRIANWFLSSVYTGGGTHLNLFFPDRSILGWPRSHILDDGSFVGLHDLTRDEPYGRLVQDQVEELLSSAMPDGTFSCMSNPRMREGSRAQEGVISSQNLALHLMPLSLLGTKRKSDFVLSKVESGALFAMSWQDAEGYIPTVLSRSAPAGASTPDPVSTAMLALVWIDLYSSTEQTRFLEAAACSLDWLMSQQITERRDIRSLGSVPSQSEGRSGPDALATGYCVLAYEALLKLP